MRLIDALETIRKAYDISLQSFISDDISSHSYYRYVHGSQDIKLSVTLNILKRTPVTLPYFFKLMESENKTTRDIDDLLDALINEKVMLEAYYQSYDINQYDIDTSVFLKPYKTHKKIIQHEVSKLYNKLMLYYARYTLDKTTKHLLIKHIDLHHYDCLYEMLDNQKALGILALIHHFLPHTLRISYKKLLKVSAQETLYQFGSWNVNMMMSMMILNQPIHTYKKHLEMYEKHVTYIEKRLFGSLDVGFIAHIFKHRMIVSYLKKRDELNQHALSYHMTMKMFAGNDDYLSEFPEIDVLSLSEKALNTYISD